MFIEVSLQPGAIMPSYQTSGSAGLDLHCLEDFEINPGGRTLVPTGISIAIPAGYEGQVRPRSGLALKHGITLVNSPGTIDSDYRGELRVIMINLGAEPVSFKSGDRIAQLVISKFEKAELVPVMSLDQTQRGEGGFGSTGS